jgi:hypothetical protein
MPGMPPLPLVQAFVVCREIWELADTREHVLIGPFSRVTGAECPAHVVASVYAHLTEARGRYELALQLVDDDGEVVWTWPRNALIEEHDPLMPHRVALRQVTVCFPQPGRFHLALLLNGITVAQQAVWARVADAERA